MIHLTGITLEDFGPFKGEQTIDFPDESGVVVVFGENGRGKSMLLNAIRYAFFGTVKGRAAQDLTLEDIPNIESVKERTPQFRVILRFRHDGHRYDLTRRAISKSGLAASGEAYSLSEDFWLAKDDAVLGPDQARHEIARVMPEQVSRFFLFDGELLQEYEELLRHESSMGEQIKSAIERILGVPVLTGARQHFTALQREARQQESRAETKDNKTKIFQGQLEILLQEQDQREKIVAARRGEQEDLEAKMAANDAQIRKNDRVHALFDERDALNRDIQALDEKTELKKAQVKELLVDIWKSILLPNIAQTRERMREEFERLQNLYIARTVAIQIERDIKSSFANGSCVMCDRPLDESARQSLTRRLQETQAGPADDSRRVELQGSLDALQALDVTDNRPIIANILNDIDVLKVERAGKADKIIEINDSTKDVKETDVRKLWNEQQSLSQEIALIQKAIEGEMALLKKNADNIRMVEGQLDRAGGVDLVRERAQRELCTRLHDLFDEAVSVYRERLRLKVQEAATIIFVSLTNDPDYTALSINENYGLQIVHRSGEIVKVRSAGNEHVVALSLMAALQRNAPLKGPIVMDSPFGRLDQVHKTNVVSSLPEMAEQVILLVYESEMEPAMAHELLKGSLKREFKMHRITSFHTDIRRGLDT